MTTTQFAKLGGGSVVYMPTDNLLGYLFSWNEPEDLWQFVIGDQHVYIASKEHILKNFVYIGELY